MNTSLFDEDYENYRKGVYSFLFTTERPAVEYAREPANTIPAPKTRE